jgi:uncharacterized integral membrane protein
MRRGEGMGKDEDGDGFGGREPDAPRGVPRSGASPAWIGAGIGAVLLLVFAIQNAERVDVDFLFFDAEVRVFSVIVVSALLGFVVGWLVGRPSRAERKLMRREIDD